MKRFLHAGEGYAQSSLANKLLSPFTRYIQTSSPNKFGWLAYPSWVPKVTGMQFLVALFKSSSSCNFSFLRTSCIYLGLFFMCLQAAIANQPDPATDRAGQVAQDPKTYQIGDKLPKNMLIGQLLDGNKPVVAKDFRGKAVIFDFWATWCGSCIANFQKLDSIQQVYSKNLSIVLVNDLTRSRDTKDRILEFLNHYKDGFADFDLSIMLADPHFGNRFPAQLIPHYVWVDANGRIKAITGSNELTDENMKRFIAGLALNLKVKES